jgi:transposase
LVIERIARFESPAKLAAYAGLVPTTYSPGGHTFHGGLMAQSNKWLRWVLVEGPGSRSGLTLTSAPTSPGAASHKPARSAIIGTTRRLLEVVWHVPKENRPDQSRPPGSHGGKRIVSHSVMM